MDEFIKVKSLEEALKLNGETIEHFNWRTERDSDGEKAGKELEAIAKAINGGKYMDFSDLSVLKFCPWFRPYSIAEIGFCYTCCVSTFGELPACARFCVGSKDAARFFGKQHLAIWKRYINGL